MSFFRMSQDLNMALRFCFKQQLPPPSYHICRFSTVQKRWIDFSFLQFLQVMNFLLVGVTVGRDRCRHPCHGRGCCNGRGTCRCLCYGRNNAEVGITPFGECPFGENTWCLFRDHTKVVFRAEIHQAILSKFYLIAQLLI